RRARRVEERGLPLLTIALASLPGLHGLVEPGEEGGPRGPAAVERARLDQALQHATVEQAEIDPRAEVGERGERAAALLPHLHDGLDGGLTHVLDGGEAADEGVHVRREADSGTG